MISFAAIEEAVTVLQSSETLKRVDGKGWSAYKVGTIIRIDIKEKVC
jgi:hypothetical protein